MAWSRPQSEGRGGHVTGETPTRPRESVPWAQAGRGGRSCPSWACPEGGAPSGPQLLAREQPPACPSPLHPVGLCTPLPCASRTAHEL